MCYMARKRSERVFDRTYGEKFFMGADRLQLAQNRVEIIDWNNPFTWPHYDPNKKSGPVSKYSVDDLSKEDREGLGI